MDLKISLQVICNRDHDLILREETWARNCSCPLSRSCHALYYRVRVLCITVQQIQACDYVTAEVCTERCADPVQT